jgi:hypothetical protein
MLQTTSQQPMKVEITTPKDSPSLLSALAAYSWPIVVLLGLILFRKSIASFLETISRRATEIGVGLASIKLPEAKEAETLQANVIREVKTDSWVESSSSWFQAFASSAANSEYALLNLGNGDEWITSRLFIFAVMLQRMKSLKVIVFIRIEDSGDRTFLGCASPEGIRWALAIAQPWLETTFAKAYAEMLTTVLPQFSPYPVAISGAIAPSHAQILISNFISGLRDYGPNTLPKPDPLNWIALEGKPGQEHATWVNESSLQQLIGIHLWRDAVEKRTDDSDAQKKSEVRRVVGKSAPYVALLSNGSYKSLVNRIALLAEIGESVV